jgi:hypothetical protein
MNLVNAQSADSQAPRGASTPGSVWLVLQGGVRLSRARDRNKDLSRFVRSHGRDAVPAGRCVRQISDLWCMATPPNPQSALKKHDVRFIAADLDRKAVRREKM